MSGIRAELQKYKTKQTGTTSQEESDDEVGVRKKDSKITGTK